MVQTEEMMMVRKGPWTEQEDLQLVCSVGLFGDRRWDYIAKVSGLNRSGKSCRLRWVNYLHPDLKRGRMTPHEERLVLELHSRWGNRWSRIARKLPGRTDNEIKNYWRTHMRKKAQEMKKRSTVESSKKSQNINEANDGISSNLLHGKGSCSDMTAIGSEEEDYSMDQIWNEIASPQEVNSFPLLQESHLNKDQEDYKFLCPPMTSPMWDYPSDSLWKIYEEEIKMGTADRFIFNYNHKGES